MPNRNLLYQDFCFLFSVGRRKYISILLPMPVDCGILLSKDMSLKVGWMFRVSLCVGIP